MVIYDDVFTDVFGSAVRFDDEGWLITARPASRWRGGTATSWGCHNPGV
ncbi:MAG: hypothetical protein ACT4NY_29145 [Pseudonocardiales bacterium]